MHDVLWCEGTLYICAQRTCKKHHKESPGWRKEFAPQNSHDSEAHLLSHWILPQKYIFHHLGQVVWTNERGCHGLSNKPHSGKFVHGRSGNQSPCHITMHPYTVEKICRWCLYCHQKSHKDAFLEHINPIDPNIQFTCEEPRDDGSIPFLNMLIIPDEEGRLNTTFYRKPTHTDQYLHWDSHHAIPSKYSVIGTLYHRAKTICSSPQQLQKEELRLSKPLRRCKYPTWAINRVKLKSQAPAQKKTKGTQVTLIQTTAEIQNHILLYLTIKGCVKTSKELARNVAYKYISKEAHHQEPPHGSKG